MKFTISKKDLVYSATRIVNVIPNKNIKPILSGAKIVSDGKKIFFLATDMESAISITINPVFLEGEGAFVVDAKILLEAANNLLENQTTINLEEGNALVHSGTGNLTLPVISAEDFPDINFVNEALEIKLPREKLCSMVENVIFCAATDEYMKGLNGVYWEFSGNYLRLVAADGFRLSLAEEDVLEPLGDEGMDDFSFIISLKAMKEILNFLKESKEDTFNISYDGKRVGLRLNSVEFAARVLEANFPDFRKVIPNSFKTKIIVKREEIQRHLKFVNIITKSSGESAKFEIKENEMLISARSPDKGDVSISISIFKEGADLLIAFNPQFLLEGISHFKSEELELNLVDENHPLQINDIDIKGYIQIIMPVRLA